MVSPTIDAHDSSSIPPPTVEGRTMIRLAFDYLLYSPNSTLFGEGDFAECTGFCTAMRHAAVAFLPSFFSLNPCLSLTLTLALHLTTTTHVQMAQGVTSETAGSSDSGFTFNDVILMMFVDIIVYTVLAWYATNVRKPSTSVGYSTAVGRSNYPEFGA